MKMSGESPYHTMSEGEFAMDTSDLSFYQMEQASARKPGLELIPMVMEEVEVTTDQPTAEGLLLEQCLQDAASLQVPQQGEPQQVEEHMVELELDPEDDARSVATSHTTATIESPTDKVYTLLESASLSGGVEPGSWAALNDAASATSDSGLGMSGGESVASGGGGGGPPGVVPAQSFSSLLAQDEGVDMSSWRFRHPQNWEPTEVLNWVYHVAEVNNMDVTQLRGEAFQGVTGTLLYTWGRHDFIKADPQFGGVIYDEFQDLCAQSDFSPPDPVTEMTGLNHQPFLFTLDEAEEGSLPMRGNLDPYLPQSTEKAVPVGGQLYSFDPQDKFAEILQQPAPCATLPPLPAASAQLKDVIHTSGGLVEEMARSAHRPLLPGLTGPLPYATTPTAHRPSSAAKQTKRPRGRPKKVKLEQDEGSDGEWTPHSAAGGRRGGGAPGGQKGCSGNGSRGGPRGKRTHSNRMLHLWEFIRDLLLDAQLNPTLIRWENRREGVFRVVQSKQIAKMWGVRKGNPEMTYEKFSRSMRFCRTAGYFGEVPKDGKYPKKLCFAFGERAHGWQPNSVVSRVFYNK